MTRQTQGIWLMVATVFAFAVQDGFSRLLAGNYNTMMVVMIRYWVFAVFVLGMLARRPEGLAAIRTKHMGLHLARAAFLVLEICGMVYGYTQIGLIESHAVFAICPLLVVAFSGLFLAEEITMRRWIAVGIGCLGVIVLLKPGAGLFSWAALFPLGSAVLFAAYSVMTRKAARDDNFFAAFFWPPILGTVLATAIGLPFWQPVLPQDVIWMLTYALISVASNWLLQKTYELAEASSVQPFAYLQIVFVAGIGLVFFDETLSLQVMLGGGIVILAGLYALTQARAVTA